MHDAVTGGAVYQEEVFYTRGTTENSMFVRRHLIEAGPRCRSVDRDVLKRGYPVVRHPGHLGDPLGIHGDVEWSSGYARAGPQEKNTAVAHPEVKTVSRENRHWQIRW